MSDYALSVEDTHALLKRVGFPLTLIRRICDIFIHPLPQANTWSRARGTVPGSRVDVFELITGLALTCRGTAKETLTLLFSLFDVGGNDVLAEDDLGALIYSCASVLRRLGFSLPITPDDSAFIAGEAFLENSKSHSAGGNIGGEEYDDGAQNGCGREELHLKTFLDWAQRAEFPVHAFEVLALPHRFSRALDYASSKIGSLEGLYPTVKRGAQSRRGRISDTNVVDGAHGLISRGKSEEDVLDGSPYVDSERALMALQECGGNICDAPPLSLPPFLSRVGSNGVSIALEAGKGATTPSGGASWCVAAVIEVRQASRYSLVDARTVCLEEGQPVVIKLSGLRPETDHRFRLVHRILAQSATREESTAGYDCLRKRSCATLRFKTLPAHRTAGHDPTMSFTKLDVEGVHETGKLSHHIEIIGAHCQNIMSGESVEHRWAPDSLAREHRTIDPHEDRGTERVVVMIMHQRTTSLEAPEASSTHGDNDNSWGKPWWLAANEVVDTSGIGWSSHPFVMTWPPETKHGTALVSRGLADAAKPAANAASFAGEGVARAAAPENTTQPWGSGRDMDSGCIDIVLHLRPNWHAPEVIRRCFTILESAPSYRTMEDPRMRVSREASTAVRALLSRTCRLLPDQYGLRHTERRQAAHLILGQVDPWLGLDMVSSGLYRVSNVTCRNLTKKACPFSNTPTFWPPESAV